MNDAELKKYKNKLLVSDLILDVLSNKSSVAEALKLFPRDNDDINIKCAFDALVYREADEDLREKIQDYASIQDDLLKKIALTLKKNEDLPKNIISKYLKYNSEFIISNDDGSWKSFFDKVKRMINF